MKKIVLCFLIILASIITVNASGLSYIEDSLEQISLSNANYKKISATVTNDNGSKSTQSINLIEQTNKQIQTAVWSKVNQSGNLVAATVLDIAKDFERNNLDYEVVAAVNGDYFTTGTTINANRLFNDNVLNYQNHDKYLSVAFDHYGNFVSEDKKLEMDMFEILVYDENNFLVGSFDVDGYNNRNPFQAQTTIYFNYDTAYPIKGDFFEIEVVDYYQSDYGNYIKGEVKNFNESNNVTNGYSNAKIITNNKDLKTILKNGYYVNVQKKIKNISNNTNIIGVDSKILDDNTIKSFDAIGGQSDSNNQSRHPRTGFGFKADGTMVLFTVDGRQANGAAGVISSGVNLREFAAIMKENGVINGYNIDGGGSTQFVLRKNNVLEVVNSPSEGPNFPIENIYYKDKYRTVYNAMLFVQRKDGISFETKEVDNTFELNVYNIENTENAYILLNGEKNSLNQKNVLNLKKNIKNTIVVVSYNKVIYETIVDKRDFENIDYPVLNPTYKYDLEIQRLTIRISYDDPFLLITNITVQEAASIYKQNTSIPSYGVRQAIFEGIKQETHEFIIEVEYKNGEKNSTRIFVDLIEKEVDQPEENKPNDESNNQISKGIMITLICTGVLSILGVVYFVIKKTRH